MLANPKSRGLKVRRVVLSLCACVALALAIFFCLRRSPAGSIRVLCYSGYDEAEIVKAFTSETGIAIQTKPYFGGDEMFKLLEQSDGLYDVVVVDIEYLEKLARKGRLEPLNALDFPTDRYFEKFNDLRVGWVGGELYGVPVRYGFNGVVYNRTHVSDAEAREAKAIWAPKFKKKVGLVDEYLLSMGGLSLAAGHEDAYRISDQEFSELTESLKTLKPNIAAFYNVPGMFQAFQSGEIDVMPCGGESVVYKLRRSGSFDWCLPKAGGLVWAENLVIPKDAPRKAAATKFIKWAQGATAQSLLMRREAYASNVPNKDAYVNMSAEDKAVFKAFDEQSVSGLLSHCHLRSLPKNQSPDDWLDTWTRFKANY